MALGKERMVSGLEAGLWLWQLKLGNLIQSSSVSQRRKNTPQGTFLCVFSLQTSSRQHSVV